MDTDTLFMATGDINEHQPRQPTYSRPWVAVVVAVVVAVLVPVVVAFAVVVVINLNLFIWVKAVAVPVSHAARLDSWHWQAAIIAAKLQASFLPPPACLPPLLPATCHTPYTPGSWPRGALRPGQAGEGGSGKLNWSVSRSSWKLSFPFLLLLPHPLSTHDFIWCSWRRCQVSSTSTKKN